MNTNLQSHVTRMLELPLVIMMAALLLGGLLILFQAMRTGTLSENLLRDNIPRIGISFMSLAAGIAVLWLLSTLGLTRKEVTSDEIVQALEWILGLCVLAMAWILLGRLPVCPTCKKRGAMTKIDITFRRLIAVGYYKCLRCYPGSDLNFPENGLRAVIIRIAVTRDKKGAVFGFMNKWWKRMKEWWIEVKIWHSRWAHSFSHQREVFFRLADEQSKFVGEDPKRRSRHLANCEPEEAYFDILNLPSEYATIVLDRMLYYNPDILGYIIKRLRLEAPSSAKALDLSACYLPICAGIQASGIIKSVKDASLRDAVRGRIYERFLLDL